jgi:hypothetical protein
VVRLSSLTPEEFYLLLGKIRHVHAGGDQAKYLISDKGIEGFMIHCSKRIGDAYFRTPRTTIKSFADLLALLEQNPGSSWESIVGDVEIAAAAELDGEVSTDNDEDFASFKL